MSVESPVVVEKPLRRVVVSHLVDLDLDFPALKSHTLM